MLRVMKPEDYDQVYRLWRSTEGVGMSSADEEAPICRYLQRNPGHSFVYEWDGKIVGAVLSGHDGRRGYIHHLAVLDQYRGRGIGRQLSDACLDSLKAVGIEKCHLFVFERNEIGKSFWSRTKWIRREDLLIFSKRTYENE